MLFKSEKLWNTHKKTFVESWKKLSSQAFDWYSSAGIKFLKIPLHEG